jgi:hypothetical protein
VTDTLVSRWRAGIQRAVSELVTRLALDHLELSLVLMRWSSLDGAYRRLDDAETAAFFDPEAMPNHPPPPPPGRAPRWRRTVTRAAAVPPVRSRIDATRRRTQLRRRPAHHGELIIEEFPAGSIVLDLDASWNLGDIPRRVLYPRLSNAGVTVVSLLHDVLPVTHPDWFDPNLARVFVDHVDAALAHADVGRHQLTLLRRRAPAPAETAQATVAGGRWRSRSSRWVPTRWPAPPNRSGASNGAGMH